jgi:hypothetical protein
MYRWREPTFRMLSDRCLEKINMMRSLNDKNIEEMCFYLTQNKHLLHYKTNNLIQSKEIIRVGF